jgi:hypothetical protein
MICLGCFAVVAGLLLHKFLPDRIRYLRCLTKAKEVRVGLSRHEVESKLSSQSVIEAGREFYFIPECSFKDGRMAVPVTYQQGIGQRESVIEVSAPVKRR